MAALLIPGPAPGLAHHLRLPAAEAGADGLLAEVRYGLGPTPPTGPVVLHSAGWPLRVGELRGLQEHLTAVGQRLIRVEAHCPETLVAAAGLGLETAWEDPDTVAGAGSTTTDLLVHRGTLRSGDHLQTEGSVLVLGDVNPGARVSAGGDVRIWGRLRGTAHAGCGGNRNARIVALQLRPLQLRIAEAVARGPEEQPPQGFCEEAVLEDGAIAIRPADPSWPQGLAG